MSRLERCCIPSKYKPVTHCIFDLDGTILDTEGIYTKAIATILQRFNVEYTPQHHVAVAGMTEKDGCAKIIKDFKLPLEVDEFRREFREIADSFIADADFMPGAERLIKHLYDQGVPLAIATSSPQYAADLKFSKKRDVFDLFHHVVCGGTDPEVIHGKPAPDIFIVAARRFPDRPRSQQCLVFEDAVNGVIGALAAGMQVVMIPNPAVPYDSWKLATLRLDTLELMAPELFSLPPMNSPYSKPVESVSPLEGKIGKNKEKGTKKEDNDDDNDYNEVEMNQTDWTEK